MKEGLLVCVGDYTTEQVMGRPDESYLEIL